MAASVQFRPHNRDLGMVMREVDEDLAIFMGIRNIEKPNIDHFLVEHSDELKDSIGVEPKLGNLSTLKSLQGENGQADPIDDFLKLEIESNDYDWLLTQAETSLLPSVEINSLQDSGAIQNEILNGTGICLESEEYKQSASACKNDPKHPASKRRSSSGDQKRGSTLTRQSSLPTKLKSSRAPTPPPPKTMTAQIRPSAPAKTISRPSTPVGRSSIAAISKSGARPITPVLKPVPPIKSASVASSGPSKSSSGALTEPSKLLVGASVGLSKQSKGNFTRPSKPSHGTLNGPKSPLQNLSVSYDAIQSLKTLLPKRPTSASRGRPSAVAANLSKPNLRQKSCSPARIRAPISVVSKNGSIFLSRSRGYNDDDDVNPVLMGTQMVERVVNSRKLAPPKQDECLSQDNSKKSLKASGFGRSLSSRSLDMAVRHMDITRSFSDNKRLVAAGALSSIIRSKSCTTKRSAVLASESPVASFSDSSESSISINSNSLDGTESQN